MRKKKKKASASQETVSASREATWEQAAKRLYEHLHPGDCWYAFPIEKRDEWIRALRGV